MRRATFDELIEPQQDEAVKKYHEALAATSRIFNREKLTPTDIIGVVHGILKRCAFDAAKVGLAQQMATHPHKWLPGSPIEARLSRQADRLYKEWLAILMASMTDWDASA